MTRVKACPGPASKRTFNISSAPSSSPLLLPVPSQNHRLLLNPATVSSHTMLWQNQMWYPTQRQESKSSFLTASRHVFLSCEQLLWHRTRLRDAEKVSPLKYLFPLRFEVLREQLFLPLELSYCLLYLLYIKNQKIFITLNLSGGSWGYCYV